MTRTAPMQRVSGDRPCPACGRPDWCLIDDSVPPRAAICPRVKSDRRAGDAGWLHVLAADGQPRRRQPERGVVRPPAPDVDVASIVSAARQATDPAALDAHATELGVTPASLRALDAVWYAESRAWGYPMVDGAGRIVGMRLRAPDGRKFAVRGGREGLFLPAGEIPPDATIYAPEGPSDTAALLDSGLLAIGRPSCRGGRDHLRVLVRRLRPRRLIMVADADGPGRAGAIDLARSLRAYVRDVRIIEPPRPHNDIRDWRRAGANAYTVLRHVAAARSIFLRKGQRHE